MPAAFDLKPVKGFPHLFGGLLPACVGIEKPGRGFRTDGQGGGIMLPGGHQEEEAEEQCHPREH